jgi:CheY-like chemotaxis protein
MILFDSGARDAFYDFLEQEFATEILTFYEEVETLKLLATNSSDPGAETKFFQGFDEVIQRFICKGAKEEINVPAEIKDDLLKLYTTRKNKKNNTDILIKLSNAQKEIVGMVVEQLDRFESSNVFKAFLVYPPITPTSSGDSTSKKKIPHAVTVSRKQNKSRIGKFLSLENQANIGLQAKESVLIIEGTPILAKLLVRYLQPRYDVSLATSATEATEHLLRSKFDTLLISLDKVGDVNGFDILKSYFATTTYIGELRRCKGDVYQVNKDKAPKMTIVGMAPEKHLKLEMHAVSMGVDAVLHLPFSVDDFRNAKGEKRRLMSQINHIIAD